MGNKTTDHSDLDQKIELPRLVIVRRKDDMFLLEASERGRVWGFLRERAQRFTSLDEASKVCRGDEVLEFV